MKRKLLVVLTLFLVVGRVVAQMEMDGADSVRYVGEKLPVFRMGNICIEYGGGGVGYATGLHTVTTASGVDTETDSTGVAGAFVYPIMVEYGFRNWFGFGGRFAYSYVLGEDDPITGETPKGRAFDFDLIFNFHLIKGERFEMPITAIWGFSNYQKRHKNSIDQVDKANGINGGLLFTPRYYINEIFGFYLNFGVLNYAYPDMQSTDNLNSKINSVLSYGGSGGTIGMGAVWRF